MVGESSQLPPDRAPQAQPAQSSTLVERGRLFAKLNEGLELNQYQLPDYVYRADLIPLNFAEYPPAQKLNVLNAAAMPLSFTHGYPALDGTTPFWEQLPAEDPEAYDAFLVYLELPEKSSHENPVRMLPMIAAIKQIPIEIVTAWAHIYYWHQRGRAYDLFIIACHRKQREFRIMSVEGKHFKMAEELLAKVERLATAKVDMALADAEADDTKLKDVVDMVQKLIQVQRISVGLAANGTQQIDLGPRYASAPDVMQHIAKDSHETQQASQRPAEMDQILESPEDLRQIQDLIVRINTPKPPSA